MFTVIVFYVSQLYVIALNAHLYMHCVNLALTSTISATAVQPLQHTQFATIIFERRRRRRRLRGYHQTMGAASAMVVVVVVAFASSKHYKIAKAPSFQ